MSGAEYHYRKAERLLASSPTGQAANHAVPLRAIGHGLLALVGAIVMPADSQVATDLRRATADPGKSD